jgi:hypothetical protein
VYPKSPPGEEVIESASFVWQPCRVAPNRLFVLVRLAAAAAAAAGWETATVANPKKERKKIMFLSCQFSSLPQDRSALSRQLTKEKKRRSSARSLLIARFEGTNLKKDYKFNS